MKVEPINIFLKLIFNEHLLSINSCPQNTATEIMLTLEYWLFCNISKIMFENSSNDVGNSLIPVHAGGTMMNACVSPVSSTCPSLGFSSNDQITKGDNESDFQNF